MYANIPRHLLDEIKDHLSIVEVIGRYIELKRAGRNHKGLCPFHGENLPSFNVSEEAGFYHCFGCGAHGDVIRFVQQYENLTFMDAVKQLAGEAGVELPEVKRMSREERNRLSEKELMLDANRQAMAYYQQQLVGTDEGHEAQEYLKNRGVSDKMIDIFSLGYAPKSWESLSRHLSQKGINVRLLEKTGLLVSRKSQGYYDRFRHRVVFPFIMEHGRVVGLGGRALSEDDPAKYLNSPESPIFSKSRTLYGYHLARQPVNRKDRVVVVEGNLDVVMMHQAGFDETVATLGTALTEHHVKRLKRMTKNLILVLDGDSAGRKAMFRSLELFLKETLNVRAVVLPEGHDPDSFLRENDAEKMEKLLGEARYLFDIWLDYQYATRQAGERGKSECLHSIIPMLSKVEIVEKELYIPKITTQLGISQNLIRQLLRQYTTDRNWERKPVEKIARQRLGDIKDRVETAEEILFGLLVHYPSQSAGLFRAENVLDKLRTAPLLDLSKTVLGLLEDADEPSDLDFTGLIDKMNDKDGKNLAAKILLKPIGLSDLETEAVEEMFYECLKTISNGELEDELEQVNSKLSNESKLDAGEKLKLQMRAIEIRKELQQITPDGSSGIE